MDNLTPHQLTAKTVQEYIDELPMWPDGTKTTDIPLTKMQRRILLLASAGKFFEGLVVFMTGVALPLIVQDFGLNAVEKGVVSAASLIGILIGATALGGLADKYGRKLMFIVEMVLFVIFLVLVSFSPNFISLIIFLFGLGASLGCDYPTAHMVVSESIPSSIRGKTVLGTFGFQAVGALVGTAIGYLILANVPGLHSWRWMYSTAIIPAILVVIGRLSISESGHWLVSVGKIEHAQIELSKLLKRNPPYPKDIIIKESTRQAEQQETHFFALFNKKNIRATVLASIPWFLQDLGTYGIGIFTPTILAGIFGAKIDNPHNIAALLHNDVLAAKGSAFLDLFLIFGIILAILFADKFGRIKLQIIGFFGCGLGLLLASLSNNFQGFASTAALFSGFMIFNLMTNLGPNAQTYLLAGEVFPTAIRGKGAGLAASVGKIGAVSTAFLFPILLADWGSDKILYGLIATSLLGAVVTWFFRIETTGKNLEEI